MGLNTVVFLAGLLCWCVGMACVWSLGAAGLSAGAVLMVIAAWPYVGPARKR